MHARGVCSTHYSRTYKAGLVPAKKSQWHMLSNVDELARTADCVICGPIRIRLRSGGRRPQCWTVRKAERKARNGRRAGEHRRRMYGLDVSTFDALVIAHGGRCAICETELLNLVVDHDHNCCPKRSQTCGWCVRGLLCRECNLGLGYFRDRATSLASAIAYLRR